MKLFREGCVGWKSKVTSPLTTGEDLKGLFELKEKTLLAKLKGR